MTINGGTGITILSGGSLSAYKVSLNSTNGTITLNDSITARDTTSSDTAVSITTSTSGGVNQNAGTIDATNAGVNPAGAAIFIYATIGNVALTSVTGGTAGDVTVYGGSGVSLAATNASVEVVTGHDISLHSGINGSLQLYGSVYSSDAVGSNTGIVLNADGSNFILSSGIQGTFDTAGSGVTLLSTTGNIGSLTVPH